MEQYEKDREIPRQNYGSTISSGQKARIISAPSRGEIPNDEKGIDLSIRNKIADINTINSMILSELTKLQSIIACINGLVLDNADKCRDEINSNITTIDKNADMPVTLKLNGIHSTQVIIRTCLEILTSSLELSL